MNGRASVHVGVAVGMTAWLLAGGGAFAAEHGGQEHEGATHEHGGAATQEHGGSAIQAEPSAEQIRQAIRDYIAQQQVQKGAFTITDEMAETTRTLTLERVHERVGKTGALHYSCTDMKDTKTGELLDLDFDVQADGSALKVVDVRIHKVQGQARYTYDANDSRIPVTN